MRCFGSICCCTTDLGTEYGLADAANAGFWSHFSAACRPSTILADDGEAPDDDMDQVDDHKSCDAQFLQLRFSANQFIFNTHQCFAAYIWTNCKFIAVDCSQELNALKDI